ncbi:cAMP-dependent protein kinase inhibitor beta-like [Sitophilus oryzae]|uniref:cAMP-dependent protein kinase inhibitor beta-like n=1 Tax=Sitophilus oryzae TaxID=7048 RepID=A0A6J2X9P7_SITOR|nr:cAMP-dependent protein kinase inhibitor beta-like [Sitophilus oryzae]
MSMVGGKVLQGRVSRASRTPFSRKAVLKMLAVMEAGSQGAGPSSGPSAHTEPPIQEFLSSGRTGRRNALPDILGQHAVVTSSDLPARLQALSTKDQGPASPSVPGEPKPGPSTTQS